MPAYIPRQIIEATMHEVANTPLDDVGYITDQMLEEQPVILEYLYQLDELPFNFEDNILFSESEREYILYIGIVVWKTLTESPQPPHQVSWDELYMVIADFEEYSFNLVRQSRTELPGAALLMIENHPEPELLRFVVDAVRPRDDDPHFPPIRPEYRAVASILLQLVLKALLESRE